MARYVESGATVTSQGERRKHAAIEAPEAGLVLLYAAEYERFPRTVPFTSGPTLVGRSPPAGVALPQEAISRVHARFWQKGDAWFVTDLNSRNGIRVAGRTVTEARLSPRDEVQIGDALFAFIPSGIEGYARFRIDGVAEPPEADPIAPELVGGLVMRRIAEEVRHISTTRLSVLVEGETGTGKELLARAIHRLSGATGEPAVLRCADASPAALDLEAPHTRGTVILDQVGDLAAESQATLLRALSSSTAPRVIAITHHDLGELVKAGRFRADLFARLSGCRVRMPPLRERKEDIYALLRHATARAGVSLPTDRDVSFGFMRGLISYAWPFNVRELENVVQWALATAEGRTLSKLPESIERALEAQSAPVQAEPPPGAERRPGALSETDVRAQLQKHGGNVSAVARELGKDRAQLHRWMRDRDIRPEDYRR